MLTATLTISGLLLGGLIAGTVLIETIFAWTGLGSTLVNAVTAKDYPSVQAVALIFGAFILVINFVVDMRARRDQPAVDDPRPVTGRRFLRWPDLFRSPVGVVAGLMVATVLVLALIGPPIWGHAAAKIDISAVSQGSSAAHPLGTDVLGRDILRRTLVAARLSVFLAVLATLLGAGVGIPIGVLPALVGRRLGRLITSAISLAVAFPTLLARDLRRLDRRPGGAGRGDRDRGSGRAVLCAPQPDARGLGRRRGLHRRGAYPRRRAVEADAASRAAERGGAAAADADADDGRRTPRAGRPQPARSRCAAALLRLGRHAHRGLQRIYVTPIVVVGPAVAIIFAALGFNLLGEALARQGGEARRDAAAEPAGAARRSSVRAARGRREPRTTMDAGRCSTSAA